MDDNKAERLRTKLNEIVRERVRRRLDGITSTTVAVEADVRAAIADELRVIDDLVGEPVPPPLVNVVIDDSGAIVNFTPQPWPSGDELHAWLERAIVRLA